MQLNARSTAERPIRLSRKISQMRSAIVCGQCGEPLVIPEWSEWLDASHARHLWHCDACGYSFETTVSFAAA